MTLMLCAMLDCSKPRSIPPKSICAEQQDCSRPVRYVVRATRDFKFGWI